MITLTPYLIKSHMVCPKLYDFRQKNLGLETVKANNLIADRYENTLKKVFAFYLYKRQAGVIPSYDALINKWEKLWFGKNTTVSDLIQSKTHAHKYGFTSYSTQATAILLYFHEFFKDINLDPFVIDEPFTYQMDDFVRIEDTFDAVLRHAKTKETTLFKWGFQKDPMVYTIDIPLQQMAYAKRLGRYPDKLIYVKFWNKPEVSPETLPIGDVSSMNELKLQTYTMLSTKHYAPHKTRNSFCWECPFRTPCFKLSPNEEEIEWMRDAARANLSQLESV